MLNMMPQVIEEENSDADNSSNTSVKGSLVIKKTEKPIELIPDYKTGLIEDVNSNFASNKSSRGKDSRELVSNKNVNVEHNMEAKERSHHTSSDPFIDIRENFDFIRKHRSGSCKSAAASLKFTKRRHLNGNNANSPFANISKKSQHLSTSAGRDKNFSSFVGMSNIKSSELSVGDSVKRLQSNSR